MISNNFEGHDHCPRHNITVCRPWRNYVSYSQSLVLWSRGAARHEILAMFEKLKRGFTPQDCIAGLPSLVEPSDYHVVPLGKLLQFD
jgi:hypothetical protein